MKTAIVTGGSRGIGLGVVQMLVRKGYKVYASYAHDDDAARQAEQSLCGHAVFFKANHADRSQTYAFIGFVRSQVSQVNCVVCNAGVTVRKSFLDTSDADWDAMQEVAVNSHLILLRELFPLIAPNSRIVFTGSALAVYPHATVVGYGVSKSAVHALARNLTKVFAEKQTTVNAIAPGFVETEWHKNKPSYIRQNINGKTALHRFATIEEAVKAYEFCIDNAYVNGAVINVDGGYSFQ